MKFRPLAHVSGFIFIRKSFLLINVPSTRIRRKRKPLNRKRLKTLSRVELFENATKPDTRGRTATGFENDETMT
jgi:hypothetical protein